MDDVRKIVVLRPGAVGDFVFALPALHALKQTYPEAELVLAGKAWHRTFLQGRPGPVDRVVEVPPVPGVAAPPDTAPDTDAIGRFVDAMRAERFDLALQMHGGGRYSNPFLLRFGARLTVGACALGVPLLDRWIAYREPGQRRLALLEIAGLAGADVRLPPAAQAEIALTAADRDEAAAIVPVRPGERLVLLQPGATDPRRRWPARAFAALGDRLARDGVCVAINGSADEAALVHDVATRMRAPAIDLAGRLSLGGLCGLLERTALLVSNDTGPLHLGLALGVPSVGIFWLTNLIEGMPLRPSALHAALAVRTRCPVCDKDNLHTRCPHDVSFVADVSVDEVDALARVAIDRYQ
ncbi:glycosyltransferase family 9 protein [Massilia putida]|uniref:glycosyltransferase family 9 protein n=1 Tax=Massilia putida TaxID=1141883 RepID=UPI0009522976|nr:glycosyltransferase family 9 protein [Massilia putida]